MQAIGRQPQRAPDVAPVQYERHRLEQTTLYRLVQQHAASFFVHIDASTGAELPRFVRDEFEAFRERGLLAHGFLRLRCGECGHDKLLAFGCKRRGFCPSCGARRMSQTAAHRVDHAIPLVVMSPLELMQRLAAQVPRPRLHLIRFHGVLALNAKLRPVVAPQEPAETEQTRPSNVRKASPYLQPVAESWQPASRSFIITLCPLQE